VKSSRRPRKIETTEKTNLLLLLLSLSLPPFHDLSESEKMFELFKIGWVGLLLRLRWSWLLKKERREVSNGRDERRRGRRRVDEPSEPAASEVEPP